MIPLLYFSSIWTCQHYRWSCQHIIHLSNRNPLSRISIYQLILDFSEIKLFSKLLRLSLAFSISVEKNIGDH